MDQATIGIKGREEPGFVQMYAGLDSLESFSSHEESCFHGAVVAPKTDGAEPRIVEAAQVWKVQCHAIRLVLLLLTGAAKALDRERGLT